MYNEEYKRWMAADLEDADLKPELSKIEGVSMTEYIIRSVRQCGNLTRFKKQEEEENLPDFGEFDFYDDETEDFDE